MQSKYKNILFHTTSSFSGNYTWSKITRYAKFSKMDLLYRLNWLVSELIKQIYFYKSISDDMNPKILEMKMYYAVTPMFYFIVYIKLTMFLKYKKRWKSTVIWMLNVTFEEPFEYICIMFSAPCFTFSSISNCFFKAINLLLVEKRGSLFGVSGVLGQSVN